MTATLRATHLDVAQLTGHPVSYDRISQFRNERSGAEVVRGVDKQWQDNQGAALALDLGPLPDDELHRFSDNNRSASQYRTKERDRWLDLLAYVRTGAVSHLIVWLFDRAYRTTEDCSALLDACREGGTLIVQSASLDVANPHNPDDIFRMKLAGLLAEYEVAKMSLRARNHKAKAAAAGKPHGGRRRFGYGPGMTSPADIENEAMRTQVRKEAEAVRTMVARVLGGESLKSIARWLTAQGLTTVTGNEFTGTRVRELLMGKHLTGQLIHHGKVLTDGNWEPIIDRGTHKAVVALLSDPKRRQQSSTARVYLLAGLATCGTCGAALRGRPAWKGQVAAYQCSTGKHCQRSVELVDLRVSEAMIRRLEKSNAEGVWVDNSAADEAAHWELEVQALEDRRKGAARLFAQGRIDEDTLADTTTELDEELSAIRANLDQARVDAKRPLAALKGLTGPGARHAWRMAPLGRKRAAIGALVSSVELHGSGRGMPFDPERHVTIAWRDDRG